MLGIGWLAPRCLRDYCINRESHNNLIGPIITLHNYNSGFRTLQTRFQTFENSYPHREVDERTN